MKTTNAERLQRYKERMKQSGFKRLSIWVHPDLLELIGGKRYSNECYGRTLERLIFGEHRRRHGERGRKCYTPYKEHTALIAGNF